MTLSSDRNSDRARIDQDIVDETVPGLFSPGGSFESFPGAVIIAGPGGMVLGANDRADLVSDCLRVDRHPDLREAIESALRGQTAHINPLVLKQTGSEGTTERAFDMAVLPWAEGAAALLLGRDITFERSLRAAWIEARRRFEDILALAADFAWETDRQGRFSFFSRDDILGHSASRLIGLDSADFLASDLPGTFANPFMTCGEFRDQEYGCLDGDGRTVPVAVSGRPIVDARGAWRGARGICRVIEN